MANNETEMTLGDHIRVGRARRKMTLRELAAATDSSPSYLSDIENDRRVPSEAVLRAIADTLGLDFDDLMASAGRFGENADRYLKRNPQAGVLFRRLSERNVAPEVIKRLMSEVPELRDESDK
jgi:transcriptional regulator with XRE-family HTH domain